MDPVTAFARLATALAELALEIVKDATPAQKQKVLDWYISDIAWWRKRLKLDKDPT